MCILGSETLNLIQSIVVIITLGITLWQMNKSNKVTKSQVISTLHQRLDNINSLAFNNPELYNRLLLDYDPIKDQYSSLNSYVDMTRTFFYELYYHNKKGLLGKDEWKSWEQSIEDFLTLPYVSSYWLNKRVDYALEFSDYIDKIIQNGKSQV